MVRSSGLYSVPVLFFLLLVPTQSARAKAREVAKALRPPARVMVTDGSTVHDVGELRMHISNWGMLGSWPGSGLPFATAPSAEWPAGSGVEHLYAAGLWVGATKNSVPAVSTALYDFEFRPSEDPADSMYRAQEGDWGGVRAPFPGADDDGDGNVDEEWLDGIDNDGDGAIDEDFAAISDQMMSCWYTDNQPQAIQLYPDHNPLDLLVRQESYQWSDPDFDDFVAVKYTITNMGSSSLDDVFIGIFADGDVGRLDMPGYWEDDATGFLSSPMVCTPVGAAGVDAAYVFDADSDSGMVSSYFGIMIVDHTTDPNGAYAPTEVGVYTYKYFEAAKAYEEGGDPSNDFERYEAMSSGVIAGNASTPSDYRSLLVAGPFGELPPDSTIVFQVIFVAGDGLAGLEENAARAKLAFLGKWFDIDGDPSTGVAGRETPVYGPAHGVVIDPCNPDYGEPIDVPEGEVLWINADCEAESLRAATCGYTPADSLVYMTGVAGRETNVHWTLHSPEPNGPISAYMDIKPGSFPNPINRKLFEGEEHKGKGRHKHRHKHKKHHEKGGVLPVAILGQENFSVEDIDMSSVELEGVRPLDHKRRLEDVGGPSGRADCPRTTDEEDGYADLVLKFSAAEVARALGLSHPAPGTEIELTLTGMLTDGTTFEAQDCVRIVGKKKGKKKRPELLPPSPNPFNPVTTISFYLPEDTHVKLTVYDVSGRLVRVLEDAERAAGLHRITWDASGLASGVYFYKLQAGDKVIVRKGVLVK